MAHTDSGKTPGAPTTTDTPEPPGFNLKRYETFRGKAFNDLPSSMVADMLFLRFNLLRDCYPGLIKKGLKFSSLLKSEKAGGINPCDAFERNGIPEQRVRWLTKWPLVPQRVRTMRPASPTTKRDGGPVRPLLVHDVNNLHHALSLFDPYYPPSVRTAIDELAWSTKPYLSTANSRQCDRDLEEWRFHMQDRAMAVIDLSASKSYILDHFSLWLDQTLAQRKAKLSAVGVRVQKFDKNPNSLQTLIGRNKLLPLIDLAFLLGPFYGHTYSQAWLEKKLDIPQSRFRGSDMFKLIDKVLDFHVITEMGGHMP